MDLPSNRSSGGVAETFIWTIFTRNLTSNEQRNPRTPRRPVAHGTYNGKFNMDVRIQTLSRERSWASCGEKSAFAIAAGSGWPRDYLLPPDCPPSPVLDDSLLALALRLGAARTHIVLIGQRAE